MVGLDCVRINHNISRSRREMSCGCGKKKTGGTIHFMGHDSTQLADPLDWGPIVWKYLHCSAEKLGMSGDVVIDGDQANYFEAVISNLYLILPCTECQGHASAYILANPISLKGLQGNTLRETARNWLFTFHNSVRTMKGQSIIVNDINAFIQLYANCFVPRCEYTFFVESVAYAVRQGWVRISDWKKWYSNSERLRMISGNIVM